MRSSTMLVVAVPALFVAIVVGQGQPPAQPSKATVLDVGNQKFTDADAGQIASPEKLERESVCWECGNV